MSATIGGNVVVRNGDSLDFCWRECVQSLLPVCDFVQICDGESTDGTREAIEQWMKTEPRIRLITYPWPDPKGDWEFFVKWLNFNRERIEADWEFQLDADEVLHENCYEEARAFAQAGIRRSARMIRHNFWVDHRHTIQQGYGLAKKVVRLLPQNVWLPSDGCHPLGAECSNMGVMTGIQVFHYGFLRKRDAFFKKARDLHRFFFDTYDPRLADVENKPGNWMSYRSVGECVDHLDDFTGTHPAIMKPWLKERGYE